MGSLQRLPIRLKIASVGGAVLLLMLLSVALSTMSINRFLRSDSERDHVQAVTVQTNNLQLALVDMETGVRGYIITANREFLQPYHSGMAEYPVTLQHLERLLQEKPAQLDRLARVRNLVMQWQWDVLNKEIDQVHSGADASATVASKAGKATMDQIRAELEAINQGEALELQRLAGETERARVWARNGTWALAGGAALLGLLLAHLLAASITRPINALLSAMGAVAAGDVGRQLPVRSEDEIGRLTEGFNLMSSELLAHQEENAAQNEELQAQQEELAAQNEELQAQQDTLSDAMEQLERERDRLAHLNQFNSVALESPDLDSLARFLLGEMLGAAGAQVGALALLEPGGRMQIRAAVGLTEAALHATSAAGFPLEAGRTGKLIQVAYPSTALLRPIYHTQLPVEHELYLPIACSAEKTAVVMLGRTGPVPFTRLELQWLEVLGSQSAAALSNRLAYEQLNRTYTELQESAAQIEELTAQVEEERDRATAQRDNLRAILESTSEGICMVDPAGRMMLVNDRFWSLLSATPQPGADIRDLLAQLSGRLREPASADEFAERALTDSAMVGTTVVEMTAPAPRILQCYTAPVHGDDGTPIGRLVVLRDVTRETEVDRMKTEFISTVSHELRTPLTSIRGYVDLILDGDVGEISEEQREFLELVSRSTVRLANLINDLLDVEKIEHGRISMRREPVDLAPVLEQVVRTFQVMASENALGLTLEMEGELPPVAGDSDRLTQVFTNLVSNAIKYTKAGHVRIRVRVQGAEIRVAVSDTGIGIPKDHLPNLFGKFYRVDNQYTREVGGTGLGLAITKAIVERHNGQIHVESTAGEGSTFTVRLPLLQPGILDSRHHPAGPAAPPEATELTPDAARAGGLVLIVEDEPDVARLIAQHVSRHGLRTLIAATGSEGLRLAKAYRPDLITLDVMLPHMDGWEVLAHLKRDLETAQIPVVFLSILGEADKGFRLGADAYLTKPLDAPKLSSVLTRLLNQPRPTVLLANSGPGAGEMRRLLEELGCNTVQADLTRDLGSQVAATSAGVLILEAGWSEEPVQAQILNLRRTPGLERLPVVVVSPEGIQLDAIPDLIGARTDSGAFDAEALAVEIMQRLTKH